MNKFYLVVLISLISSLLHAQVPNASFENWTAMGTYDLPDQWGNMNTSTAATGIFTTAKGTPGAAGSYFVKLTTKDVGGVVTPGMIVSGLLNTANWKPKSGFPYSLRAETLKGKYQFMGYNSDSATISAWLTKWNTSLNRRDTIASLVKKTTGMVHVWTALSLPFIYRSTENPDTAVIMISSSSVAPKKNSFIWVDDLLLDGLVTAVQQQEPVQEAVVFPSPAQNEVNLEFSSRHNADGLVQILDNTGKIISQSAVRIREGSNTLRTELGTLHPAPGMYFIRLQTQDGTLTRKFVIGH